MRIPTHVHLSTIQHIVRTNHVSYRIMTTVVILTKAEIDPGLRCTSSNWLRIKVERRKPDRQVGCLSERCIFLPFLQKQSYNDVALLMNSELGKLQFQKSPETIFSIRDNDNDDKHSSLHRCDSANADTDQCICSNYGKEMRQKVLYYYFNQLQFFDWPRILLQTRISNMEYLSFDYALYFYDNKQQICALATCSANDDDCPNPITPHGFCCPICGKPWHDMTLFTK